MEHKLSYTKDKHTKVAAFPDIIVAIMAKDIQ
jgi:hypothetical protein